MVVGGLEAEGDEDPTAAVGVYVAIPLLSRTSFAAASVKDKAPPPPPLCAPVGYCDDGPALLLREGAAGVLSEVALKTALDEEVTAFPAPADLAFFEAGAFVAFLARFF